jgi:hypothetical protein
MFPIRPYRYYRLAMQAELDMNSRFADKYLQFKTRPSGFFTRLGQSA